MQYSSAASTSWYTHDDPQASQGKEAASGRETKQPTASAVSLRSYVLLCRDGIPEALEDLYSLSDVGTIHNAAWVVIHFLMLETGYRQSLSQMEVLLVVTL